MQGSMRERRPGVWQIRVCAGRDPATRRFRYVTRTVEGGKRDAQRAAAKLISEVELGLLPAARGTVAQLLDQWMGHIEAQGRAPSTLSRYRSAIRSNIVPVLGHLQLAQLTAADVDAFYANLLKAGLNPLSVRKCHAILSASCRQAVRWGWLDRSPIERTSPPSARGREIVPPTLDEVRVLLRAAETTNPELASLIFVAVTTGCRRGELCGLRWSDVDLDASTIVVRRSISDAGGKVSVKGTKTHQARRLALDPATLEVLRRHLSFAEARAIGAETTLSEDAYVWSQMLDGSDPYRPDRVTGTFRNLTENQYDARDVPHTATLLRHRAGRNRGAGPHHCRAARSFQSEPDATDLRPLS